MVSQLDTTVKFKEFTLSGSNKNYYMQPDTPVARSAAPQPATTEDEDIVVISDNGQPIKKKSHKKRNLAFAVGSSALFVGGGVMMLMRGLPKNTQKYLESLKKFMEKKLEKSNIKGADSWSEFWEYSIRKVDSFIEKSQSINNFTSLKDIGFKWLMDKSKPTAKAHQKITDFFERIARRTVIKSYKNTRQKFDNMYQAFDKLDESILKSNPDEIIQYEGISYTKRQLIDLAKSYRQTVKDSVDDFTSTGSLLGRYMYIKKATAALYSHFWDKLSNNFLSKDNIFLKKEMWQTYIPDVQIMANKKSLNEQVAAIRHCISYTDKDKTEIISGYLKTLKNMIPPSDKDGLSLVRKLEWFLDNPEGLTANKENFIKTLKMLKERPFEKGLEEAVIQNQTKLRESNIKSISDLIEGKNSGKLQNMLAIYKSIAPYELAQSKAESSVRKAVSSFDKALKTETTDFFDKIRDLRLGSAPTDILSIIAPTAMIGYGLSEAADKDERISVMNKAGIPILGSIATSIFCTTRLISGGLSLAFGAITGAIFGVIGSKVDDARLAHKAKNHTNGEVA
ncbi:hypothetical protein IKP85_07555 [bacterium]|nr:hypothetical protein [bacterium]